MVDLGGTLTVLFTDVVGSTDLIARLGDREGERVIVGHLSMLRDVLVAHGGREVKKTGDGLMAVFAGTRPALECSVAMQRGAHWQAEAASGMAPALRIGVHCGESLPQDDDYYGVWVVVARRLCDLAEGGTILVSDLVRTIAGDRDAHRFVDRGEHELRGIPERTRVYELEWEPAAGPPIEHDAGILVVDDNEANVMLLGQLLERGGYSNVETTTDSRLALPLFTSRRPDLVMLDLHMPHLDGFEVMGQILGRTQPDDYVPILILTADVSPEAKKRALAMGAKDFVAKPFDPLEVLLRINNLLETRRLHLQLRAEKESLEQALRAKERLGGGPPGGDAP